MKQKLHLVGADGKKIGPTGKYPDGKISPSDEGELKIAISHSAQKQVVLIRFGIPVDWIGVRAPEARHLAQLLLSRAEMLEEEINGGKNNVGPVPGSDPGKDG